MNNKKSISFQLSLNKDSTLQFKSNVYNVKSLVYEMTSFAKISTVPKGNGRTNKGMLSMNEDELEKLYLDWFSENGWDVWPQHSLRFK